MSKIIRKSNLDANETIFFARELEFVKARSYDVEYPQLRATELIPVSTDAGEGAESITYQQFDSLGMAKIISNYADDLPRADVTAREFTSPIRSVGKSYGYNVQEIRAAQFVGRPLEQRRANSARLSIEQRINRIGFFGDEESGLQGLLTHPNITRTAVANTGDDNGTASTRWIHKTPDEILADMNDLVNGIFSLTNGIETPNTLALPLDQYTKITTTARSSTSDTTIRDFFLTNSPFINTIEPLYELENAGQGIGTIAAGGTAMIAYDNNPDKLTFEIPIPFEQFPVQERGLNFVVNCHARTGGVIVYYPLSIAIAEGI